MLGVQAAAELPRAGAPIGVVGSGLDVVYPADHQRLWAEVGERGVLLPVWRLLSRSRWTAQRRKLAAEA